MRLKTLALFLMAGFGASAVAQDNTQALQQALKQMPQAVLSKTEAIQVSFMDVQAWLSLENGAPTPDGMEAAWKESMAATVAGKTVEAGNAGNPILAQIMDRYMRRDLSLLQIGLPR